MSDTTGTTPARLSLWRIVIFSLSTLPVATAGTVMFVYLPPYLAGHLGVSLAVIGGVWASVRVIDLFVDPLLGHLMDITTTRFGRYRVWLAAGVPIFALAMYMLFMASSGIDGLYIFVWLFILYVGNSMLELSRQAWSATLAPTYNDRSRIFGAVTTLGVIATVVALLVPVIGPRFGLSGDSSVRVMGWMIIVMAPLGVWTAVLLTPEHINKATVHHFVARDYWDIITKPEVVRLFLAQVALTLGPGWMSAMYIFYFHDARLYTQQESTLLLLIYILAGIAGAPLTAMLASRIGKHRTLSITTTAFSIGLLAIFVVPKGNVLAAVPVMAWCGFMAAGFGLMIAAMMADVGDEIRLQQGKERISLLYAVLTFASKLTAGFAIGLTFPLLAYFGYDAKSGAHNTPAAIHALEAIFITGPIVFVMLGGLCVWGWRLTAERHAVIRSELDARDAVLDEAPVLAGLSVTQPQVLLKEG
jgi:glycoside/pentoside/hexuronide:cation symporter, GPH family